MEELGIEWFARFQQSDERAFTSFHKHYGRWIIFSFRRLAGEDFLKEMIINKALLKAWDRRETFQSIPHLKSWLYRVVKNDIISSQRSNTSEKKSLEGYRYLIETLEQAFDREEDQTLLHEQLSGSINALPPLNRQIIRLSFLEERSNYEIAQMLNLTNAAVVARKSRALDILRVLMRKPGFG
jgi:RNA polymerase sigma-70 factor (ECF subfamily)